MLPQSKEHHGALGDVLGGDLDRPLQVKEPVFGGQRKFVRTSSGGLIAPVFWSDNWIELTPGEATTLTAELPDSAAEAPVVQIDGWNIQPATITPETAR